MMSRLKLVLLFCLLNLALTGCGIRPGQLTPATGDDHNAFPHVYPHDPRREADHQKAGHQEPDHP